MSNPKCSCFDDAQECLSCSTITSKYANVTVPMTIIPYTIVGDIETECVNTPVVTVNPACSCGCDINITQTLCIKIPISYATSCDIGETTIDCLGADPN